MASQLDRDFSRRTEEQITALARAGNPDAFGELFERNHRRSTQLALSIVSNPLVAEEVVSQSFYKAFIHLEQLTGQHFHSWFNTIVVNECYQHLRTGARKTHVPLEHDQLGHAVQLQASPEESPEARARSSELMRLLLRDVGRLPVNLRMPLLLSLRQQSLVQISQELGISVASAKSRLFRARNELKRRARRYLPSKAQCA